MSVQADDRPFTWTEIQIRRKFKHAHEFGVTGPYTQEGAASFVAMLQAHVSSRAVRAMPLRFMRGTGSGGFAAICYVDEATRLAVVTRLDGTFVSGYRLSVDQLRHLLRSGKLGGGA